jgi:phospholipase C
MSTPLLPHDIHPGWIDLSRRLQRNKLTRRAFIPGAVALAGGLALTRSPLGTLITPAAAALRPDQANWPSTNKIKHVVILCQENRSFDHYFGAFASTLGSAGDTAVGFNKARLTYQDANGQAFKPYHLTQCCNQDPDHSWDGSHAKWNNGAMDGWVTAEGGADIAIGYFEPEDHIYHVELAQAFTLCDRYYCSQIGPTLPNRLYLWSGTSGWNYLTPTSTSNSLPFNNPSLTAPPPMLNWPTMADLLTDNELPWKCYSVADGSVPSAIGAFNPLIFFESILTHPGQLAHATADFAEFTLDLALGKLPAVSWIVTEALTSEHPPAPPDMGQLLAARVVQELMNSSAWESMALFITYDEGGGFFDHVRPRIVEEVPAGLPDAGEAVGAGFRVPMFVVSPWARPNTIYNGVVDHTSILQFIERTFSTSAAPLKLPTIAPRRRNFDDLTDAFDFTQAPISPPLPTAASLFARAKRDVLVLNAERTVASCSNTLPTWLPQILGV